MSKPWDNESTPLADRLATKTVLAEDLRSLERQLRYANRLLAMETITLVDKKVILEYLTASRDAYSVN